MATKGQKIWRELQANNAEREAAIQRVEEEYEKKWNGDKLHWDKRGTRRVAISDSGGVAIGGTHFEPLEAVELAHWILDMCQEETE